MYSYGQTKCKSRLFLSSKDISQKTADTIFVNHIRHELWHDSIMVKTTNNIKKVYADENVWGYQDYEKLNGCLIYRNYNQQFYKIRQIGSLIMYSQTIQEYKDFPYTFYYFSKTLESPIFVLKWKNIKEQFKDNACFLEKLEQDIKWYQDYSNLDKENGKYKFIEFYDLCK